MPPSRARRARRPAPPPLRRAYAAPPIALLAIVIAAAGVAVFWNSLRSPFIWDDQTAIVTNQSIQRLWPLAGPLSPPRETPVGGRPLVNLSFAVNYAFGQLDVTGYHAVNIALHVACALLLFGIVRRTLARTVPSENDTRPLFAAASVALLWTVHPLQTEVVNYVTQRSESLMALFFLLTLYAAIRALDSKGRKTRAPRIRWQSLCIAACACGMASKESMVVAPLVIVLYDAAFEFGSLRDAIRARLPLYAGLAATWIVLAALSWDSPRSTVGATATVGTWTYLLNQARMIGRYLRLSLWPDALVLDYGVPAPIALRDVFPSALLVVALLAAAVVAFIRWPKAGFLGPAFFLTLAPTSSVIPIVSEVGAERRMYLPLAALATLAVIGGRAVLNAGASGKRGKGAAALCLMAFILAGLAVRTVARNAEYADPLTLWRTVVDRYPHGRARMALATELAAAGQHAQAIRILRDAVPDFPDARAALGTELVLQGQREEGAAVLRTFIAADPARANRIPAHLVLAESALSQGDLEGSAVEWQAILAIAPSDRNVRAQLARVRSAQAEAHFRRNDADRAEPYAREAVQLAPDDPAARNLLGVALASKGNMDEAIASFREALRLAPDHAQARNNLERALRTPDRAPVTSTSRPRPRSGESVQR